MKRLIALNTGQYDLTIGTQIAIVPGAFLVPTQQPLGPYRSPCPCDRLQRRAWAGRQCRHNTAIEIVEHAQQRTMPRLVDIDRAAQLGCVPVAQLQVP